MLIQIRTMAIWVVALLIFVGCGVRSVRDSATVVFPERVRLAQQFLQAGHPQEARTILADFLQRFPGYIPALCYYQDSFYGEKPGIAETKKFRTILAQAPSAARRYIHSRAPTEPDRRLAAIRSLDIEPGWWADFDKARVALLAGDENLCQHYLERLLATRPELPEGYLIYAYLHLRRANWQQALSYARQARELAPYLVKTYFFEAAQHMIYEEYQSSLQWFQKVRILFPSYKWHPTELYGFQSAFWRELINLCRQRLYQSGLSVARQAEELFPQQPLFMVYHAEFLLQMGQQPQAIPLLKKALAINPYDLRAVQLYRRILFHHRRYRQAFQLWLRIVDPAIVFHPDNQISQRYLRLQQAVTSASAADPASLSQLAMALTQAGWESEALIVYRQIPGSELRQEYLQRHLAFMQSMKQTIYDYYQNGQGSVVQLLDRIDKQARRYRIPVKIRASRELESYFVLVREVDPFSLAPNSLGAYLARYNKFWDLGNNYGYVETRLMNRLSVREYRRQLGGRLFPYHAVIGDETFIDTFLGYHSGSSKVAGRAFLSSKGFYIALDVIRPTLTRLQYWHQQIQQPINATAIEVKHGYDAVLAHALLKRAFYDFVGTATPETIKQWQPFYLEVIRRNIDIIHNHELGHNVDFPCFLPVYARLGNILRMLWNQGFSAERIQGRFETVAETFGVAHTAYPFFYLWQVLERLDVRFDNIFEMVYWAWYGKLPDADPYYQASLQIFQDLAKIEGCKQVSELRPLTGYRRERLRILLQEIYRRTNSGNCW